MEFKNADIVKIISLNSEGLIMDSGLDLETNKIKYAVFLQDERRLVFCLEEDLIFISTLEEELEKVIEEESEQPLA